MFVIASLGMNGVLNCTFSKARIPALYPNMKFIIAQGSIVFIMLIVTSKRQGKPSKRVTPVTSYVKPNHIPELLRIKSRLLLVYLKIL
jgi:hypothetical protein